MSRTNKYTLKSIRSRNTKLTKRARKLGKYSTPRNKLQMQNGGAEHINVVSPGIENRAAKRRQELLARAHQLQQQQPISAPISIPLAQPLGGVNLELVKQKILSFM